jgi:hypothetical protein
MYRTITGDVGGTVEYLVPSPFVDAKAWGALLLVNPSINVHNRLAADTTLQILFKVVSCE